MRRQLQMTIGGKMSDTYNEKTITDDYRRQNVRHLQ